MNEYDALVMGFLKHQHCHNVIAPIRRLWVNAQVVWSDALSLSIKTHVL